MASLTFGQHWFNTETERSSYWQIIVVEPEVVILETCSAANNFEFQENDNISVSLG